MNLFAGKLVHFCSKFPMQWDCCLNGEPWVCPTDGGNLDQMWLEK